MNPFQVASARQLFTCDRSCSPEELVRREESFFRSIHLPNDTSKTTFPGRLTDLDLTLRRLIRPRSQVHLFDVGISSGITTLELIDTLEHSGCRVTGIGVDSRIRTLLRSFLGLDILYDGKGNILQIATRTLARGRPRESQRSARSWLLRRMIDLLESTVVRRWLACPDRSRPIALVSPRLAERPGFAIVEHDVLDPKPDWLNSFDLIRAANVLNLAYFSPPQLSIIVGNLVQWLRVGGLLAVCRTNELDGQNHGSVFMREEQAPDFGWSNAWETARRLRHLS